MCVCVYVKEYTLTDGATITVGSERFKCMCSCVCEYVCVCENVCVCVCVYIYIYICQGVHTPRWGHDNCRLRMLQMHVFAHV